MSFLSQLQAANRANANTAKKKPKATVGHAITQALASAPKQPKAPAPKPKRLPSGPLPNLVTQTTRPVSSSARNKLPGEPSLKRFPILKSYTPQQAHTIVQEQGQRIAALAHERGHVAAAQAEQRANPGKPVRSAVDRLAGELNNTDRQQLNLYKRLSVQSLAHTTSTLRAAAIKRGQNPDIRTEAKPGHVKHGLGGALHLATADIDRRLFTLAPNLRLATAPLEVGRAFVEHPLKVGLQTLKSVPLVAEGAAAGSVELFTHPRQFIEKMPKQTRDDLVRRYGDLLDNPAAFRKRIEKEGALPEILDATTIAAPAGKLAGTIGTRLAEAGKLGKPLKDFVEAPRPKLRVAAGERGAVEQDKASNITRLALQRLEDRRRAAATAKRVEDGKDTTKPGFPGLVPGKGEVVKKSLRAQERGQRKGIADLSARTQQRVRRDQDREVRSGINKEVSTLSKPQRLSLKYYVQLGLPADTHLALQELEHHRQNILDARETQGTKVGRRDEIKQLDAIIADPAEHLGAKVREVADLQVERAKRTAKIDPGVTDEAALGRQYADQASHLGIKREGTPIGDVISAAVKEARSAKRAVKTASTKVARAERKGGRTQGRAEVLSGQADRVTASQAARAERQAVIAERTAHNWVVRAQRSGDRSLAAKARAARGRARTARANADELRANVGTRPVRTLRAVERNEGKALLAARRLSTQEERAAVAERALQAARSAKKQGVQLHDAEPIQSLVARVRDEATRRKLVEPGYFFSREFERGGNSAFAGGTVSRAVAGAKQYTGRLFETGRQDASPTALALGVARNIKRAHNWHGVSDMWARNTPEWGRNRSLLDLEKELDHRGLDPSGWRFIDTGKYRKTMEGTDEALDGADVLEGDLHKAVVGSTLDLQGAQAAYRGTGARLTLIPKAVSDEIVASTKPAGAALRSIQKFQGLQSRILLHTNPTFVPIQVLSNTPLAVMALKGNVRDLIGAQRWYRNLDQAAKDAVDDYIGVSASRAFTHSPRYGAAAEGKLTKFFDAVADNPKVRGIGDSHINPLNWNPWLDDKQNAFFRRAVFYNDAKRLAGRKMGADINGIVDTARPVMDVLKMAPGAERDAALRAAEPQLEKIAKRTDDLLGNYTSYTAFERQVMKSSLLFYGFLRWSVQFTFYTLPVKHPLAAAMAAKLGQLHNEEVISLLSDQGAAQGIGTKQQIADLLRSGAEPYVFGRVWMLKNGKLASIDVARVNPLLNPLTSALEEGPFKAGLGLISPVAQAGLDTAYGTSGFSGQPLKDSQGNKLHGVKENLEYIAGSFARTSFPIRVGEKLAHPGSLSDDSVPFIADKNADISGPAGIAREQQKRKQRGSNTNVLFDNLLPLLRSKEDNTIGGIAGALQAKQKADAKAARKHPSGPATVQDKIDAVLQHVQEQQSSSISSATQDKIDAVLLKVQEQQAGR